MGVQYLITKAIAGRAVAEKSEQRRLERKYSKTAEDLESITQVAPEQPTLDSSASSIRSTSSYFEPLPPRLPKEGSIRRPRSPLQRSQSALSTYDYESLLSRPAAVAAASPIQVRRDTPIDRVYSFNDVWESQKDSFRGMGRHTISANATPEDQMNHLHRTMSDLTPRMVEQLGDFPPLGVDPPIWQRYRKFRTDSTASTASSQSIATFLAHRESPDPKRRVIVTRGFAPALISPSPSSIADDASSHYRKDSTVSMTSMSSDGESRQRRPKSRHASLPISDKSATSPLTTIIENPHMLEKPQPKKGRPCKFNEDSNNESAVSDSISSDEGAGLTEYNNAEQQSHLTKQMEGNVNTIRKDQQSVRPHTRSGAPAKLRQAGKPIVERSRTVRHVVRPSIRRAHSPKHAKGRPAASKTSKAPIAPNPQKAVQNAETVCPAPASSQSTDNSVVSKSSDEAGENPTDLSLYMEKTRLKHSSKDAAAKHRQKEDDHDSIDSSSTAKTLIPMVKKIVEDLPIHRRQRSATAFRVPPNLCQPPKKAGGAKPEASQATAH